MADQTTYFFQVYGTLPQAGPGDDVSTAKAYKMISGLPEKPAILDTGCGPGRQTLALARLSKGMIIALDNHQPFLDKVNRDAAQAGLSQYIKTLNRDMNTMSFPADHFDLIWAEGALYLMGFENGLQKCRAFLKKDGAIAVTELVWLRDDQTPAAIEFAREYEGIKNIPDNLALFKQNGYELIGHFTLPVISWFSGYYDPMQIRIHELRPKWQDNETAVAVLDAAQAEINSFKQCSDYVGYEFFIARRF